MITRSDFEEVIIMKFRRCVCVCVCGYIVIYLCFLNPYHILVLCQGDY